MPPKRPATATPAAAPKVDDQALSLKDQTLFKQVLRFYETKQYKKALKAADTILKKQPNHGGQTTRQTARTHTRREKIKNDKSRHSMMTAGMNSSRFRAA